MKQQYPGLELLYVAIKYDKCFKKYCKYHESIFIWLADASEKQTSRDSKIRSNGVHFRKGELPRKKFKKLPKL